MSICMYCDVNVRKGGCVVYSVYSQSRMSIYEGHLFASLDSMEML